MRVSGVLSGQLRERAEGLQANGYFPFAELLEEAAERIDEQEAELYELREMIRD